MRIIKAFKLSLNILVHSKLRSWLTIIGIIIGIGAVVAILSISAGAKQNLEERLGNLGADIITISPGASRAFGAGGEFRGMSEGGPPGQQTSSNSGKNLTSKDVLVLRSLPNVKEVMGIVSGRGDLTYSSKTATISIQGVDTLSWKSITTEEIVSGRPLTKGDTYSIVLGGNIVSSTFPDGIPLNSQVVIEGKTFKVVGITKEGRSSYIPINIARVTLEDVRQESFDSITVKIENVELADNTTALIEEKLMMARGILYAKDKDFSVSSTKAMQETIAQTLNTMSLFLGAIAAISLIVGAVGIANTMFTSVLEKTKEIGIMKAIGAKNRDILLIFLFNSGLIGFVGGLGGIILGYISSSLISSWGGLSSSTGNGILGRMFSSTFVSTQLLVGALLFAILIGIIAGAIPAYRASRLNPVDALRYE
jgi:putative ABC transport system permease protein